MSYSIEQLVHDKINLKSLVRRLEKSVSDPFWDESPEDDAWIKSQGTLQKVKYARKLLKHVELYDEEPSPTKTQQFDDIRITLDRVEVFMKEVAKRTAPNPRPPIVFEVPTIPSIPSASLESALPIASGFQELLPNEEPRSSTLPADDLLPSDTTSYPTSIPFSPPTTLIPSTIPLTSTSTTTATASRPSNSNSNTTALQQELSDQLAQMAIQLKRNALHFSDSLAKDKAVVEETEQKLEGNYGVMERERVRLRDHSGKSRGTTCLVVMIIMAVVFLFALMVLLIRFSRR